MVTRDSGDYSVRLRLLLPSGCDETRVSAALAEAFDFAREAGMEPAWVTEAAIQDSYSPTTVYVCDPFSGPGFHYLCSVSHSPLLGPRTLVSCLKTMSPVPRLPSPLYTVAMRGLTVSLTGFPAEERSRLAGLVSWMAGVPSPSLHDGVTHLVAASVLSEKYSVAVLRGIPVMTSDWVEEVWRTSSCTSALITATEARFSCHLCPALLGLTVTITNLSKEDRETLGRVVTHQGRGSLSPSLEKDETTVLVTGLPKGEKFLAARRWNIPCVSSHWVFESIEAGHPLPFEDYRMEPEPLEDDSQVAEDSTIPTVEETILSPAVISPTPTPTLGAKGDDYREWMSKLDLAKVKAAGCFLDGCRIFLLGFTEEENIMLARVVKFGGGVRLHQLGDSVTHVVEGAPSGAPSTGPEGAAHVRLEWMVASMSEGRPAIEALFPVAETVDRPGMEEEGGAALPLLDIHSTKDANFETSLLQQYGL